MRETLLCRPPSSSFWLDFSAKKAFSARLGEREWGGVEDSFVP